MLYLPFLLLFWLIRVAAMPFLVMLAIITKDPPKPFAYGLCLVIGHDDSLLSHSGIRDESLFVGGDYYSGICRRCSKERFIRR